MQTLNEFNNFHKSIQYLQELPPVAQNEAFDFIEFLRKKYSVSIEHKSEQITANRTKKRQAGSLAGQIVLSDDFDEPLECFKEYM